VHVHADARSAVGDAQLVITAGPIINRPQPVLDGGRLAGACLLLPIDFDFYPKPELVAATDLFLVDDIDQYEYYRTQGHFAGWPRHRRRSGRRWRVARVASSPSLGVGALDAAFADAVLDAAERAGSGQRLAR
jgi:hypothetical protein